MKQRRQLIQEVLLEIGIQLLILFLPRLLNLLRKSIPVFHSQTNAFPLNILQRITTHIRLIIGQRLIHALLRLFLALTRRLLHYRFLHFPIQTNPFKTPKTINSSSKKLTSLHTNANRRNTNKYSRCYPRQSVQFGDNQARDPSKKPK